MILKKILVSLILILLIYGIRTLFVKEYITSGELVSLIGIIILGTTALFQEQFKRWWLAPALRIKFKLEPPYCSKTPFYIWWGISSGKKKFQQRLIILESE